MASEVSGTVELIPAAFIDRDGVINEERDYVGHIDDFHLLPGAVPGLRRLADAGYALVVITNQAGIAKGLYDEATYAGLTGYMRGLLRGRGIVVTGVYHCPHHPQGTVARYATVCDCRKPAPGMLLRAARELGLDLSRSVLVGDKTSDTQAGRAAGVRHTVLVESGHALPADAVNHADHLCADLAAAADWLCREPA
jgi:D-glycero-D-manno-heptose 1,7-bisphosphate phosphatase